MKAPPTPDIRAPQPPEAPQGRCVHCGEALAVAWRWLVDGQGWIGACALCAAGHGTASTALLERPPIGPVPPMCQVPQHRPRGYDSPWMTGERWTEADEVDADERYLKAFNSDRNH